MRPALFNLMRNIGGSIGIAVTGTMVARHQQATTAVMGSQRDSYRPGHPVDVRADAGRIHGRRRGRVTATNRAYAALFGMVQHQASIVSFVGLFQLLGFVFFAILPLVLLMKRPRSGAGPMAAH